MESVSILWIDLRIQDNKRGSSGVLDNKWIIHYQGDPRKITESIDRLSPAVLCFEFDFPDIDSLVTLQRVKRQYPSIPIIMLTEQHSESLAIWALRNHVRDYFFQPISQNELQGGFEKVLSCLRVGDSSRSIVFTPSSIPTDLRFHHPKLETSSAQSFVEKNFHTKILEKEVAQACGMTPCAFSRTFKKEHGVTFQSYLTGFRINKAVELLKKPNVLVADVAFTVGFQDPSYFARIFRRTIGMTPSAFHAKHKA